MPRSTNPIPPRQRYFESWTYDARILLSSLAVAAPACALLGVVLIWPDIRNGALNAFIAIAAILT